MPGYLMSASRRSSSGSILRPKGLCRNGSGCPENIKRTKRLRPLPHAEKSLSAEGRQGAKKFWTITLCPPQAALVQALGTKVPRNIKAAADMVRGFACYPEKMSRWNTRLMTGSKGRGESQSLFRYGLKHQRDDTQHMEDFVRRDSIISYAMSSLQNVL